MSEDMKRKSQERAAEGLREFIAEPQSTPPEEAKARPDDMRRETQERAAAGLRKLGGA